MADSYLGEIRMAAFNLVPSGWAACDGGLLEVAEHRRLFALMGTTFGGDGTTTFGLPDLRSRIPLAAGQGGGLTNRALGERAGEEDVRLTTAHLPAHKHVYAAAQEAGDMNSPNGALLGAQTAIDLFLADAPTQPMNGAAMAAAGGDEPHGNIQPFLVLNFIVSLEGDDPDEGVGGTPQPFVAELRPLAGARPPKDWALCDGQTLSIALNTQLFMLLGTTFGGNGQTTFRLPDLREAVPMDDGAGPGLTERFLGETGGSDGVTLARATMPSHTHALRAAPALGEVRRASADVALARSGAGNAYHSNAGSLVRQSERSTSQAGGSQPHTNLQPWLGINYMISLAGVVPSRN